MEYAKPESAFHCLAHSIIEQMLSMKAAATIEQRIITVCDNDLCPSSILSTSIDELRNCGVSKRKALYLHALAEYASDEDLEALSELTDEGVRSALTCIPGIGKWTCDMFLLFYLDRSDVLPVEDGAFRQAFRWLYGASVEHEGVRHVVCSLWRPYSSIAARYLYRALNSGMTKSGSADKLFGV
jgi:DNA-3-methyladenine glycosylase II